MIIRTTRRSFGPIILNTLIRTQIIAPLAAALLLLTLVLGGVVRRMSANSVYATGNLTFSLSAATANLITTNDDWSLVPSVEGYAGQNITATHGINPQTVLNTEFVNNQLPNSPRNVAANKGNPSAFNAGGLAEFDTGTYIAIGFQGNVQANPYLVFYLNTTGRYFIRMSYMVQDIDGGSNDSVSSLALQYRVGETGLFINLPDGFIADATDGSVAGRITNKTVLLPQAAENQPKVQVRLITTNAANSSGGSTPDEWIGVNTIVFTSSSSPTAAAVTVSGRVTDATGRGIRNAFVTILDSSGMSRTAVTNAFGYYSFSNMTAGSLYALVVSSKRHTFASGTRVVTVLDDLADVDFVADN